MHEVGIPVAIVVLEQVIPAVIVGLILFGKVMFGRIGIAGASLCAGVVLDLWSGWGTSRMDEDAIGLTVLGVCGLLCAVVFRECLIPMPINEK